MNAGPNIAVFLLMALLVLGWFVAMIGLIVYAVIRKRPGVFFGGAAILMLLAVAASILMMLLSYAPSPTSASVSFDSGIPTIAATTSRSSVAIGPRYISTIANNPPAIMNLAIGKLVILGLLLVAAIALLSRRARPHADYEHRRGWGLGRLVLLGLVVMFAARVWSSSKEQNAREWSQAEQRRLVQDRHEVERAERAPRHTAASATQAPADIQVSIEQLWDQLNQPKIDLHASGQDSAVKTASRPATMKANGTKSTGGTRGDRVDSGSSTTAESLAHSAAGLGQLLAEVSTIAMRVADASKFISRTLVAIDSPADKSAAPADVATPVKTSAATKSGEGHKTTAAKPVVAKAASKSAADAGGLNEKIGGEVPANKPRPAWVDEPQKQVGNVLRQVVAAGPYATPEECYAKTDELLKIAVDNYVRHSFGGLSDEALPPSGPTAKKIITFKSLALDRMGIDLAYIRREIANDEYQETVERSVGPMKNLYTLLEFSPAVQRELKSRWNDFQRDTRLTVVGLLSGSVLGVLGLAFGLLRVDTATKGYYTKRLFLGVPAAIIGLVALVALLGQLKH